ncbi:response regulator transcription factor [Simiduia aestuariiviva]|uniref:Two-component system response regulator PhoP n=1 Tax=Simiduia aestuariiviva TaxID=1510459 RepID=A0A839UPK8_9GAMM|nr:response regulator transcription factor [Simiduia aestuariiviva]MBB3168661.1 two-component system response regulator PhoP [Simiduia aestuariiviva]
MRLLLIEDEPALQSQINQLFSQRHWSVDVAGDGREGEYLGREYPYDVAVVDLGLPQMSGMEVISQWRKAGISTPILILTARDHWQQKVEGLEAGADDYLTKPFHPEELLARVNALARRAAGQSSSEIVAGPYRLDLGGQQLSRAGEPITLTSFEYRLIEYLMLHAGKVISKAQLTEHIYAQDYDRDSNVIEVLMTRLRKKMDPNSELKPLRTVRGQGYQFVVSDSGAAA